MNQNWRNSFEKRLKIKNKGFLTANRLTPSLLVKGFAPGEIASMEFARRNTTISIPRVHMTPCGWPMMDFIDGEMLCECWDRLSTLMQFRVACTMRLYIKQMRSLKHETVGALENGHVVGIPFDSEDYGTFKSPEHFARFSEWVAFDSWADRAMVASKSRVARPKIDWTPVFTHGDLNSGNILLDKRGSLWIVDWATAGFYPSSMEVHCMRTTDEGHKLVPSLHRYYRPFIFDSVHEEELFWGCFSTNIHRFYDRAVSY